MNKEEIIKFECFESEEFELKLCKKCYQMTNWKNNKCCKCKTEEKI